MLTLSRAIAYLAVKPAGIAVKAYHFLNVLWAMDSVNTTFSTIRMDSWPPRTLLEPGSAVHHPKTKKDLPWPYCPNLMKYRSCTDGSSTLLRNFYETRQGIVVISDVREPCPRMGTADWMVVGGGSSRLTYHTANHDGCRRISLWKGQGCRNRRDESQLP
jgi:hypothetical protein